MMTFYTSLLLLVNIFISISNGDDVCVSGGGSSNTGFFGQYILQSGTSNGKKYYKEETICGDNYLYNIYNRWAISNTLGSSTTYIRCSTRDSTITTPENCPSYTGATSVSVSSDATCGEDLLTDRCASITISGVENDDMDGSYNAAGDGYYVKTDGSRFISYWSSGGNYIGNAVGDIRCASSISGNLVDFPRELVAGLTVGTEVSFSPEFPSGREVSISCSATAAAAAIETPSPVAASASGDLCITYDYTGTTSYSMGSAGISLASIAGPYSSIGDLNDYPAYQLSSACSNAIKYVIMYVPTYQMYMMVTDQNNPTGSFFNFCKSGVKTDPASCTYASYDDLFTVSSGGSCDCASR